MKANIDAILRDVIDEREHKKINFRKADLVIKAPDNVEIECKEEFSHNISYSEDNQMFQKTIYFNYCYAEFPLYLKPHDLKMQNHVLYYNYNLANSDIIIEIYIIDKEYFENRSKELGFFQDVFIRPIENSFSDRKIYSLDKKKYGTNHIYQINSEDDDTNSVQVITFEIEESEDQEFVPGVLDLDLLDILKDRLMSHIEYMNKKGYDDIDTLEDALNHVNEAIDDLSSDNFSQRHLR